MKTQYKVTYTLPHSMYPEHTFHENVRAGDPERALAKFFAKYLNESVRTKPCVQAVEYEGQTANGSWRVQVIVDGANREYGAVGADAGEAIADVLAQIRKEGSEFMPAIEIWTVLEVS